jgi:uncharacterized protein
VLSDTAHQAPGTRHRTRHKHQASGTHVALLTVRVTPRAGRTAVGGVRDGILHIKLAAAPVDGAANDALVALLSEVLHVPRRSIRIRSGERSRTKVVEIDGVSDAEALRRLAE